MRDAFILGSRYEGLYRFTGRPLLELVHDTNHLSELWPRRLHYLHYDSLQFHYELGGPMLAHSLGGHLYYITFINDFSRKTWIYYLKHKDEAFKILKGFKSLIKNQTGKKINIFRFDNDGEYTSNEFIDFFKKEGVMKPTHK